MKKSKVLLMSAALLATIGASALFTDKADAAIDNGNGTVTVQAGDTYMSLANQYGKGVAELEQLNGREIGGFDIIYPGETVTITTGQQTAQPAQQTAYQAPVQQASTIQPVSYNNAQAQYTGGDTISYASQQMAAQTGVSASTWAYIINRESNGQVGAVNPTSGATGLFQSIHNPGNTVDSQIANAVWIYNQQGMSAWAL